MTAPEYGHQPVLLAAALAALAVRPDGSYVDATFGRGGHSAAIAQALGPSGRLLAIDRDATAITCAYERFAGDPRITVRQGSFATLATLCAGWMPAEGVDGLLLDLGVSSPQLDDPARGFSFLQDGPLDMRMDPSSGPSAADWLASAGEQEIADVIFRYGEERFSRRIARAIVAQRAEAPLLRTADLARLIERASPSRERHKHPATRSFQAIRIHINGELAALEAALQQAMTVLRPGGRLVVISFHSLEDRLVKRFMRDLAAGPRIPKGVPVPATDLQAPLRILGKPVRADAAELAANPRARSAILRVAERLA